MTNINTAILDAIKSHIPETIAGELRKYLDEANLAFSKVALLTKENDSLNQKINILNDEKYKLENSLNDANQLKRKYENGIALINIEKDKIVEERANHKYEVANAQYNTVMQVLDKFLRNGTVRTNIQRQVSHPVEGIPPTQYSGGTAGFVQTSLDYENTIVEND